VDASVCSVWHVPLSETASEDRLRLLSIKAVMLLSCLHAGVVMTAMLAAKATVLSLRTIIQTQNDQFQEDVVPAVARHVSWGFRSIQTAQLTGKRISHASFKQLRCLYLLTVVLSAAISCLVQHAAAATAALKAAAT
jgi:hypothetical protein